MAEPFPDEERRPAKRAAWRSYLGVTIAFIVLVGITILYWSTRPSRPAESTLDEPRVEGTSGHSTPGGHNPQLTPDDAREEIDFRGGHALTGLRQIFREEGRNNVGRRVELTGVHVERVESPRLFWIREGNDRIAVVMPSVAAQVQAGQAVDVVGAVEEEEGNGLRVRASRVDVIKP